MCTFNYNDSNKKKDKKMTKNNLKVVKSDNKKQQELKRKKQIFRGSNKPNRPKFWKRFSDETWPTRSFGCRSISTGSLSLDLALGIGGLPKGRIIEIYGPESFWKNNSWLYKL